MDIPADIRARLPLLLPLATTWAEACAKEAAPTGTALTKTGLEIARHVGVQHPERIRVVLVDNLPLPEEPTLRAAVIRTGLLGSRMAGLTFGYTIFAVRGHDSVRLLSHEFRHVQQYEAYGSIGAFLNVYTQQIADVGYDHAPLELDARAHEVCGSSFPAQQVLFDRNRTR